MHISLPRRVKRAVAGVVGEEVFDGVALLETLHRVGVVAASCVRHRNIELTAPVHLVVQVGEGCAVDVEEQVVAGLPDAAHAVADDDG